MESPIKRPLLRAAAMIVISASYGCKQVSLARASSTKASPEVANEPAAKLAPYTKLDELRKRFPGLNWWEVEENPVLGKEFEPIRQLEAWKAFVAALKLCDDCVNRLLEEDITDWSEPRPKIESISRARNAWRRAVTFGIRPPALSRGVTSFEEEGLHFRVHVADRAGGVLVVRSQRDQVVGIFDLRLDDGGRQHVVAHMLERALRYPDIYLSYPWDIIMATDTIYVPDIDVFIDRIKGQATLRSAGTEGEEVRK